MDPGFLDFCGQRIFSQSTADCIEHLRRRADHGDITMIATPNPEILLASMRRPEYADVLRGFDLLVPDGFGLTLIARLFGKRFAERISGSDLLMPLARIASEHRWKVVMIGDDAYGSSLAAAHVLLDAFPDLTILRFADVRIERAGDTWTMPDVVAEALSLGGPCVVFVGLGMEKQEGWMQEHLYGYPDVRMAIGCGGAFAMIAGTLPRAPEWMRSLGLEWLWRLWLEPRRVGRIFNAVVVFPVRAILYELLQRR